MADLTDMTCVHGASLKQDCDRCRPADPAQSAPSAEPITELRKALNCLYIAVDSSVADDVVRKVNIVLEAAALRTAQLERERDGWQTLFYESEEYNCSCNIVDTTKPVGDLMNYVCEWHEKHPHITVAREGVLTLATRAETAESALRDAKKWYEDLLKAGEDAVATDCRCPLCRTMRKGLAERRVAAQTP